MMQSKPENTSKLHLNFIFIGKKAGTKKQVIGSDLSEVRFSLCGEAWSRTQQGPNLQNNESSAC